MQPIYFGAIASNSIMFLFCHLLIQITILASQDGIEDSNPTSRGQPNLNIRIPHNLFFYLLHLDCFRRQAMLVCSNFSLASTGICSSSCSLCSMYVVLYFIVMSPRLLNGLLRVSSASRLQIQLSVCIFIDHG